MHATARIKITVVSSALYKLAIEINWYVHTFLSPFLFFWNSHISQGKWLYGPFFNLVHTNHSLKWHKSFLSRQCILIWDPGKCIAAIICKVSFTISFHKKKSPEILSFFCLFSLLIPVCFFLCPQNINKMVRRYKNYR